MSLKQIIIALVLATAVQMPGIASADRALFPHDLYQRTTPYHGHPPTFPPPVQNTWYKWGYFGAYPGPRTVVGGHYSHRNHYTELRFSAPR